MNPIRDKHPKIPKKKRVLNLNEKIEVLKRFQKGEKLAFITKTLNLPPSTVRTICKRDSEKIQKTAVNNCLKLESQTRIRNPVLMKMETLLCTWIDYQSKLKMPLSQAIIQQKARSLFEDLEKKETVSISEPQSPFKASRGWFEKFKKRSNLHNVYMKGEAASADAVGATNFVKDLKSIIVDGGYSAKQVFNVDETGLFWKRLPKRTFISRQEKSSSGHKPAKQRLTLLLGGNAHGDYKLKPFLIYQSENPRAMKNLNKKTLDVHWRSNKKAWMTASLFEDWVENCCVPEIKNYCKDENLNFKALVLIDNAPGHPVYVNEVSENVKFIFIPPNTTSLIQPMDQGVISTFKSYYLRRTFKQLINATDNDANSTMISFWKNYNILKAVENIGNSWKEVKNTCMNRCWRNIWPECCPIPEGSNEMESETAVVRTEIINDATLANFEGMQENDIDEILNAADELTNEELIELCLTDTVDAKQNSGGKASKKETKQKGLSRALKMIDNALEIFNEIDEEADANFKFTQNILSNVRRYRDMYLKEKKPAVQLTMDHFIVPKEPQMEISNESADSSFDEEDTSSSS